MPTPQPIIDVITQAKTCENVEGTLEALKAEKAMHQDAITALNVRIANQTTIVLQARADLKAAANFI